MRLVENMSVKPRNIKAIVLDVDGVLTDGRVYFSDSGEQMKVFYVHDGTATANVPSPCPSSTETLPLPRFATARSGT